MSLKVNIPNEIGIVHALQTLFLLTKEHTGLSAEKIHLASFTELLTIIIEC